MLSHPRARRRYLGLDEIAETFGISTRTVRRRIADGTIPAYRVGRLLKVDTADVEKLLHRVPTA